MNYRSSWFSARNVLEYFFWFKSRLHFHARASASSRSAATPSSSARDAARARRRLGRRAASPRTATSASGSAPRGDDVASSTTAELATREETPDASRALIKQRTRWNQGFLQVLRKGDWRRLPPRASACGRTRSRCPFLQAASCLILPFALASVILLHLPIELALLSFVPVAPLIAILAVEVVGLHSLRAEFGLRVRLLDHVRLVLGAVPYQVVLSFAAAHAAWREFRGVRTWEKTEHVGAHL